MNFIFWQFRKPQLMRTVAVNSRQNAKLRSANRIEVVVADAPEDGVLSGTVWRELDVRPVSGQCGCNEDPYCAFGKGDRRGLGSAVCRDE
jgi:hypothetical protein